MSKKESQKDESQPPKERAKDKPPFVWYRNTCKGLLVLPVVGHLKPGWNKVPREVHEATTRPNGTKIIPPDAPVQIRDDGSLTLGQSEPAAIGAVLQTNQRELLDEVLMEEKRPIVRTAAEHQKKVISLDEVPREDLKRIAETEDELARVAGKQAGRDEVKDAVAKAEELK